MKFSRIVREIGNFLKQRPDTRVTLMLDYYGIHDTKNDIWPGYELSTRQPTHAQKHSLLIDETEKEIQNRFSTLDTKTRFIPYFSMHETEALYFSAPEKLAASIGVEKAKIDAILRECGEPERINDSSDTAPSKRLKKLSPTFKKTSTGLFIAQNIGIPAMRTACPLFNKWITQLESSEEQQY